MTTAELIVWFTIGALILCTLSYIVSEEKEEADIFKNWKR